MYQSCKFIHSSLSKSFLEFLCHHICGKHFSTINFSDGNMTDLNLLRQFYVKSMDSVILVSGYCNLGSVNTTALSLGDFNFSLALFTLFLSSKTREITSQTPFTLCSHLKTRDITNNIFRDLRCFSTCESC